MSEQPEPLIGLLEAVWSDIDGLCDGLTEEQWNLPTDCPGWSVQDNVAHMIGTERMLAGEQPGAAGRHRRARHVRNDIGKANEQWIARYRDWTGAETARRVPRGHRTRGSTTLRAMTTEEWDEEGLHARGSGSVPAVHGDPRVRLLVPRPGHPRGARARPGASKARSPTSRSSRIPPKGLPYVVGKKAGAPPGSDGRVRRRRDRAEIVAAIGAARGPRRVARRAYPATPTARITLDRRTFARLAGGRWTGDHARERRRACGSKATPTLGDRVVDNMAFTI